MKTLKFLTASFASIFLVGYVFYVAFIYFNQENMVFRASKLPQNHSFSFSNSYQEVFTTASDGAQLHGIYFKANHSKGLIFYLHGNKGTVDLWGQDADFYTKLGYDIFYADYRGFGKSEGSIKNEKQVLNDAVIVFDAIQKRFKPNSTIILGYSIGTGIAAFLAQKRTCQSLILLAPFYNFTQLSSEREPSFPNFLKKFSFETNVFLKNVSCPVIIFHGNKDFTIPIQNSLQFKKIFKSTDLFYVLEGQSHVGINENSQYKQTMSKLLY